MANKTTKQLGGIVYFVAFLILALSPINVFAQAYGEDSFGDCEYSDGCTTTPPVTPPVNPPATSDEDNDPNTPDLYTGPNGESFVPAADEEETKEPTTETEESDEIVVPIDEDSSPSVGPEEEVQGELSIPGILLSAIAIIFSILTTWWLIVAKRRKHKEEAVLIRPNQS